MAAVVGALRADLETNVGSFRGDMDEAASTVEGAAGRMERAGRRVDKAGGAFASFGKTAQFGLGALAATALVTFTKQSIGAALENEKMGRQFESTFTAMGSTAMAWSNQTADALKRTDGEVQKLTIGFGQLAQGLVPTQGEAAKMSQRLVQLSYDLAEFKGVDVSSVADKLTAALSGNVRGLRQLGIVLTDDEVKVKAVEMGLAKTTKTVSAQDKALASYNLILEKTVAQHGYAATQLDTNEARLRAFQVQIDELGGKLGELLLPPLIEVVKWLGLYADGVKGILDLQTTWKEFQTWQMEGQLKDAVARGDTAEVQRLVQAWKDLWGVQQQMAGADAPTLGGGDEFDRVPLTADEIAKRTRDANAMLANFGRQVRDFGINDLPTGSQMLNQFSDGFNTLVASIEDAIATLKAKEDATADEVTAIYYLQQMLDQLPDKYDAASDAAERLFNATHAAIAAQTDVDVSGIQAMASDLAMASGRMGATSRDQQRAIDVERQLHQERLRQLAQLKDLERQKAEAELANDDFAINRLQGLTDATQAYYDLLMQTTGQQITAQEKLLQMVDSWQQTTSDTMADILRAWRDSSEEGMKEIAANFFRRISDEVINRKTSELADSIFSFLGIGGTQQTVGTINAGTINVASAGLGGGAGGGGAGGGLFDWVGSAASGAWNWASGLLSSFGGFFAGGGSLAPGQWGIAGEDGPEPIFAGSGGLNVIPNEQGFGGGQVNQAFYISTPNPDGFRQSRRQITQMARRELG